MKENVDRLLLGAWVLVMVVCFFWSGEHTGQEALDG